MTDAAALAWRGDYDDLLLAVAHRSIARGPERGPLRPGRDGHPEPLLAILSSFVTLKLEGRLRGCIGSLEPQMPLVEDVALNAHRAAYYDPRFQPLPAPDRERVELHISVLGPREAIEFSSEEELRALLRPGVDGLVLRDAGRRATFLPDVWESLPEPADFLAHLKAKAGLPRDHWSTTLRVERYTTRSIG